MSTGFIGAMDEIRVGRFMVGTLIVILRLAAGAVVLAEAFLLVFAAAVAVFLLLAGFPEAVLLLTFCLAPLVDVLVTAFFLELVFVVFLTTFAREGGFFGAFFLLTFLAAAFVLEETLVFPDAFLGGDFLLTRCLVAAFFVAPAEAFLRLRLAADLLAVFFRAVMPLSLVFAPMIRVCKRADYT